MDMWHRAVLGQSWNTVPKLEVHEFSISFASRRLFTNMVHHRKQTLHLTNNGIGARNSFAAMLRMLLSLLLAPRRIKSTLYFTTSFLHNCTCDHSKADCHASPICVILWLFQDFAMQLKISHNQVPGSDQSLDSNYCLYS